MAVAYKMGKEFLRLLKKNFPLSNSQYKIFNKMIKSSYRAMPNVASLINKSNIKNKT